MSRVGDVETDGQMLRLRQEAAARSSSEPRRPPRGPAKGAPHTSPLHAK